jgi:hypothetical protein
VPSSGPLVEDVAETSFKGISQFQAEVNQENHDGNEAISNAPILPRSHVTRPKSNILTWFLGSTVALVVVSCGMTLALFGLVGIGAKKAAEQAQEEIKSSLAFKVTADEICREYSKGNEFAADKKYKDKVVEVTGTMKKAEHILGSAFIILDGGIDLLGPDVQCFFADKYGDQLAKLDQAKK